MSGLRCTLLLLGFLQCAGAAATVVYRWTDASGQTHYGQEAPAGATAERVTITHEGESAAEAKQHLARLLDAAGLSPAALAADKQAQAQASAAAAGQRASEAEHKRECVTAEHTLGKLENWAKRILVTDAGGTVSTMNDDARQAAIARVRGWVSENGC